MMLTPDPSIEDAANDFLMQMGTKLLEDYLSQPLEFDANPVSHAFLCGVLTGFGNAIIQSQTGALPEFGPEREILPSMN